MAGTQIIIELGKRIAFVQCLSGTGKNARFKKSFMIPMENGAYDDGQITDVNALGAYLTACFKNEGVTAKRVSFVVTSGRIASREVTLPAIKTSRLAEIVNINAADYFPVDLSGYYVTYSRLGSAEGGQHRVIVYATPLPLLKDYFALAEVLGMKLQLIEYAGDAQRNLYKAINPAATGNLFVYLNDNSSYLSFMNGDQLALQRTLPFGGGELVEDFMPVVGLKENQYIDAYCTLTDSKSAEWVHESVSRDEIQNVLNRLAMGIARSLDYFTSNFAQIPIENIVLTGPYAALIDLTEIVSAATGRTTFTMRDMPGATAQLSDFSELMPYINCTSAVIDPVDLRPPTLVQKKKTHDKYSSPFERSFAPGCIALIVMLAVSAILCGMAYIARAEAELANQKIKSEIEVLAPAQKVYDTYVIYKDGATALTNINGETISPNDTLIPFLDELERKLPSEIVTLSAIFTPENVMLNATVPKFEDVARVLMQLRSFDSIDVISVSPLTETIDITNNSYVAFSVICSYVPVNFIPEPFIGVFAEGEGLEMYATDDIMMEGAN